METWTVELITDDVVCNTIEIDADEIIKKDFHVLLVDGIRWEVPSGLMSFGRVGQGL